MRPSTALALLASIVAVTAGCGGDDDSGNGADTGDGGGAVGSETFDAEGIDLTFEYPSDLEQRDDIEFSRSAGSAAAATAGVGIDDTSLIAVQRFDLATEVNEDNLGRVQREADALFSQLAGQAVEGEETEVGGLPALEYQIELQDPPDTETRAIAVFDGAVQYLINCQSAPEERKRIEAACDLALDTLEVE